MPTYTYENLCNQAGFTSLIEPSILTAEKAHITGVCIKKKKRLHSTTLFSSSFLLYALFWNISTRLLIVTICVSLLCNLYIPWVQSFHLFETCNVFYPYVGWLHWGNQKKLLSLTALTIQVASKACCASVAFWILFQNPIFNDLSKDRVSNTCVVYLCTEEEGFQAVCLVDQDWLRNTGDMYLVIPKLPSTGGPVCFLEGGGHWTKKIFDGRT